MADDTAPPKLAATRGKWNTVALVGLLLLAGVPATLLAFAVSAYWSPRPVRLGTLALIGPRCDRVSLIMIRNTPERGPRERLTYEATDPTGKLPGVPVLRTAHPVPRALEVSDYKGRLPVVTGRHLWRVGPLSVVWH